MELQVSLQMFCLFFVTCLKVIGAQNVPANPEVHYSQPTPEFRLHVQLPPALPVNNTRKPPTLGHQSEVKNLAKRTPPTRPAPPAPKLVIPQVNGFFLTDKDSELSGFGDWFRWLVIRTE